MFRLRRWLQRIALLRTAGHLERNEQRVLELWWAELAGKRSRAELTGGRDNLRSLVAALRAETPEAEAAVRDDLARWAVERASSGLADGLDLMDLLEPLALFRGTVQREVGRMLAGRLWLAVPSDVLKAVERINSAIDVQMMAISAGYLRARDQVIRANEAALAQTNRQLVLLNQEMQHRIKNNLQTITDLLSLETSQEPTKPTADYLRESLNRVKCIAAAHELLSPENAETTEMLGLARRVAEINVRGFVGSRPIAVEVEGEPLYLPAKGATSLALVLNELVANSLEHGFPGQAGGIITVRLGCDDGQASMTVTDNGIGFASDFDSERTSGLGLRIARALVADDLKGSLEFHRNGGTSVVVTFPLAAPVRVAAL